MPTRAKPVEPRFWANVLKKRGCWEWIGCKMTRGYGQISVNGKATGAHVVSVRLSGRVIPKDHVVMHKCDNKSCVNPKHLLVVLQKVNMADFKKKRIKNTYGITRETMQIRYQAELKRRERRNAKRI